MLHRRNLKSVRRRQERGADRKPVRASLLGFIALTGSEILSVGSSRPPPKFSCMVVEDVAFLLRRVSQVSDLTKNLEVYNLEASKSVKVTTLADNFVQKSGFVGQWGLSFLLEVEDRSCRVHKIIFDTGAVKEGLLYNIKKLSVNLSDLEYLVLSHGHRDHTSATVEVLKMAKAGVKVIAHPHLYLPKFYVTKRGKQREGGLAKGEKLEDIKRAGGHLITTSKPYELFSGVSTTGEIPRVTEFEKVSPPLRGGKRLTMVDGKMIPDMILDDQALLMNVEKRGPIVITGCAHSGVVNTLLQAQKVLGVRRIYGVIGGLHLVQRTESYIDHTVEELRNFGLELISPGHCTGFKATCVLHQAFPKAFVLNCSGRIIRTGKGARPRIV